MHVVIMGCGRVGSTLAQSLEAGGHSVAIVDSNSAAFRRLPEGFAGRQIVGVGFDRDTLVEAGIEQAAAFAAVSSGDNSNVISARVARETFGVETVVARIYDPRRAEVYSRLGIQTVATVRWTADEMLRRLLPNVDHIPWSDPTGYVMLLECPYDVAWTGRSVQDIEERVGVRVAYVTRYGEAVLATPGVALQDGDLLYVLVRRDEVKVVVDTFAAAPEEQS